MVPSKSKRPLASTANPFHVGNHSSQREALLAATFECYLAQSKHLLLIEMAFPQIGVSPVSQLQAAAPLCRGHIDAHRPQPFKVFLTQLGIDDMEGLLTALEAVLDKWQ